MRRDVWLMTTGNDENPHLEGWEALREAARDLAERQAVPAPGLLNAS